jgi:hypothetical protein
MQIALVQEKLASKATRPDWNKSRSRLSNVCLTKMMHSAHEQTQPKGTVELKSNEEFLMLRLTTMWESPARGFGIHTLVEL